ncbi:NAD-dependent epimerase/dehydratase family protein [Paenibacillus septentrionalis]|uniref:NAD-dependent epimerase/dehydratase family protein n=1 Tax=Paenibacillus septentrionalis TaxID=429342 RepID=A0ABW1V7L6_9BACL
MLLVTGITGHTGTYFFEELVKAKFKGKIKCFIKDNLKKQKLENSELEIDFIIGDLNDIDTINKAMNNVDTVLHIYNIHHSKAIVQTAIANKVNWVILVHTTGIYSKFKSASNEYEKIEAEIKELNKNNDVKITILRPTMIYGDICDHNVSKFIKIVDRLRLVPVINNGKSLIQPVNARDLGKAYYNVLISPDKTVGKEYILSGKDPISVKDMYKLIASELGKRVYFINVPLRLGIIVAKIMKLFSFNKIDFVEKVQRMTEDRSYPHNLAKNDFNYSPINFQKGLEIEVNQYIKSKNRRI